MKNVVRIIGDVHGKIDQYLDLIRDVEYSVQLGDLGFDYSFFAENRIDSWHHKVIGGNHDNYEKAIHDDHFLGDFGTFEFPQSLKFFYIRGAYSIDKKWRMPKVTWWEEEELTEERMDAAFSAYRKAKPDIMLTHDCPLSLVQLVSPIKNRMYGGEPIPESRTQHLLELCFQYRQPQVWLFGHYHNSIKVRVGDTSFRCLNELEYLDWKSI